MAILSQVIENIEESLKSQAMFMDSKNSYLITMSDFQKSLRDFKVIRNNWEYAEAEIRSKAASVMNLKLMVAIDYAAQCNRDTVELLEEIIELQNNKKLMKRIEALGSSSIETDNNNLILAVTGIDGTTIPKMNPFRARFVNDSKYIKNKPFWYLNNNYIYIINSIINHTRMKYII